MIINKSNAVALVLGIVLGAVFFRGSDELSNTPMPSASASILDERASYTVEMDDASKSELIELSGDYQIDWQTIDGECGRIAVEMNRTIDELNFDEAIFSALGFKSGTSYVYGLDKAPYYLEANNGYPTYCNWKATFTPLEFP